MSKPKIRTIADGNLVENTCPECGSDNIWGDELLQEGSCAWQEVECQDCGYVWRDVYVLVQQEPAD